MKKLFFILTFLIIGISQITQVQGMTLKAGISLSDQVPKGFFGSWKITSVMEYSNNPSVFNEISTDYWNLSKSGDVITLANPNSGAQASVTIKDVDDNKITFTHVINGKNAKMTETPTLTLDGENFSGTDKIVLERYKYGKKTGEDVVIYKITAQKISGESALSIFMKHN